MAKRVVGLDLGSYSVKLMRLEAQKGSTRFEASAVLEELLPIQPEASLIERQRAALASLSEKGLLPETDMWVVGLGSENGHMRNMQAPFTDTRKIEAVLPGLLEAEIPINMSDVITTWHLKSPEAPTDTERTIQIAFGKKEAIAEILSMLQAFDIDPRIMHLNAVIPYELVREYGPQAFFYDDVKDVLSSPEDLVAKPLSAFIVIGHSITDVCIFDREGLVAIKTLHCGGWDITKDIAHDFGISLEDAARLKHDYANIDSNDERFPIISHAIMRNLSKIIKDISRIFITLNTEGQGKVIKVVLAGGTALIPNIISFMSESFRSQGCKVVGLNTITNVPAKPEHVLSAAMAISGFHVHAKASRFNFRKDEFLWRGSLDFLRTNTQELALWGLVLICAITTMWATMAMILDKESHQLEKRLRTVCDSVLEEKGITPSKCLSIMKEQITSNMDLGIPEYSASDIYINLAKYLPPTLEVVISEVDILEKKVRIKGKTANFESVDNVVKEIAKIPCFVKVEKGRAQQSGKSVEFQVASDIDCINSTTVAKR